MECCPRSQETGLLDVLRQGCLCIVNGVVRCSGVLFVSFRASGRADVLSTRQILEELENHVFPGPGDNPDFGTAFVPVSRALVRPPLPSSLRLALVSKTIPSHALGSDSSHLGALRATAATACAVRCRSTHPSIPDRRRVYRCLCASAYQAKSRPK